MTTQSKVLKIVLVELLLAKGYKKKEITDLLNDRKIVNTQRLEILSSLLRSKMITSSSVIDWDGTTVIQKLKELGFGKKQQTKQNNARQRRKSDAGLAPVPVTEKKIPKSQSTNDLNKH